MKEQEIYYYSDELNDEFSGSHITPRVIDEKYKYLHKNIFWNLAHFLVQNVLSVPIKVLYAKLKFRIKYIGKEKLKKYKKEGYFVYANHTQVFADTFLTSNVIYPKRNYLIVNPENVSMKFLGNFVQMFGAIPIPTGRDGMKNFLTAIKYHIQKGHSILGYKSHMGAGSITSNVKSDKKLVVIKNKEEKIETGLKKIGAMLGDEVEVGCGSVLNPGTIIGSHTNIYPLSSVRGVVKANSIYKNQNEIVDKK